MKKVFRVILAFLFSVLAVGFVMWNLWCAFGATADEYEFSKPGHGAAGFFIIVYIAAVCIVTYYLTRDKE